MTTTGAYGFRFSGLDDGTWLSVCGAGHWPEVRCTQDSDPDASDLALKPHPLELSVRADIAHSELVHPLLGRAASALALAHGADGMHAGAAAGAAGAWCVIGSKGAGKSTLLAALARAGVPIVTDDILVFRDGVALAGPRCIDLRPDAKGFGLGVAVRPSDPRRRIALPSIDAEHPIAGLVHLEWSSENSTLDHLDARQAIKRLLEVRGERGYPRNPHALLDLAALPTVVLRRPRTAAGLEASVEHMRRLLVHSGAAVAPVRSRVAARR